jgi:hypothetical protein
MAAKSSRPFHPERGRQPEIKLHLSHLQKSVLHWLRTELRHRRRAGDHGGVPYPELVRGLDTDKTSLATSLRQLLKKELVTMTLPRGGWAWHVALTKQGEEHAQGLFKDTPRPSRR